MSSTFLARAPAIRRPETAYALGVLVLAAIAVAIGGRVIAQQIASGLMLGAVYLTVAVAFTLTIGVLNFLNFTILSLFMLTGMVAWGVQQGRVVPVYFIGIGERMEDLQTFNAREFATALLN